MFTKNTILFSPLEQFDAVTWIIRNFIYESKVHARQYIIKGHTDVMAIKEDSTDMLLFVLFFYLTLGALYILIQNN